MLDKRRNLFLVDLQWFGTKILTQKFALFGFLGMEGKKNWSFVVACWVYSLWHMLTHVGAFSTFTLGMSETIWVKSRILNFTNNEHSPNKIILCKRVSQIKRYHLSWNLGISPNTNKKYNNKIIHQICRYKIALKIINEQV